MTAVLQGNTNIPRSTQTLLALINILTPLERFCAYTTAEEYDTTTADNIYYRDTALLLLI